MPLEAAFVILAAARHRAERHVVGALWFGAGFGRQPDKHARAFGIFYTGTIGAGAIAPISMVFGDAIGLNGGVVVVAAIVLITIRWR